MAQILVIDDDEQILQTLREVVETLGHRVTTAGDGKAGLDLFERGRFDAVITDLAMPEVDGLTVLRRIKRRRPATGVLVITGNSTVDLLAAAVNMGVDAYVTKPFKITELDEQLSRILAAGAMRDSGVLVAAAAAGPAAAASSPLARAFALRVPIVWAFVVTAALLVLSRFLR